MQKFKFAEKPEDNKSSETCRKTFIFPYSSYQDFQCKLENFYLFRGFLYVALKFFHVFFAAT